MLYQMFPRPFGELPRIFKIFNLIFFYFSKKFSRISLKNILLVSSLFGYVAQWLKRGIKNFKVMVRTPSDESTFYHFFVSFFIIDTSRHYVATTFRRLQRFSLHFLYDFHCFSTSRDIDKFARDAWYIIFFPIVFSNW